MLQLLVVLVLSQASPQCHSHHGLPDALCTPGETSPVTLEVLCARKTSTVRHVTDATKKRVLRSYGMQRERVGDLEIDHLIPLELGGTNEQDNLWPEPAKPRPGFHEKDKLENELHRLVCLAQIELSTAQQLISTDWVAAYFIYVEHVNGQDAGEL